VRPPKPHDQTFPFTGLDKLLYRSSGEVLSGTLASDSLDQALGLLDELRSSEADRLAAMVTSLLEALPPSLD